MKTRIESSLYFKKDNVEIQIHTGRICFGEDVQLEVVINDNIYALINMKDLNELCEALQNYYKYLGG